MEETKKKGFNTSSNSYTILYSVVIVVIVAFLLAFVSSSLKPQQDENVALDKKKQILAALNIRNIDGAGPPIYIIRWCQPTKSSTATARKWRRASRAAQRLASSATALL